MTLSANDAGRVPRARTGPAPEAYIWRGQTYFGMRTVARAAGVTSSTVAYHLGRHGHLDFLGEGSGSARGKVALAKPVSLCGRHWPSIAAFAADLGVHYRTAFVWLRDNRADLAFARLMMADAGKAKAGAA